jgi:protein tyrosine/serine phosphatase
MLSRPPRPLAFLFGLGIAALLVAGPWSYYAYRTSLLRNLHVVREGVLYRSGQMTLDGLKHVIQEKAIKTVISLRDSRKHPDQPPPDAAEEDYCWNNFIAYHRLPASAWSGGDGSVPAAASVQKFLEIMRNPANYPVLIHCFGGVHRTGAFCAVYRMELQHWSNEEAIAEMVRLGYAIFDEHPDVRAYLETYRPAWRQARAGGPVRADRARR